MQVGYSNGANIYNLLYMYITHDLDVVRHSL